MALNFRKFIEGLRIVPKAASTASEKGDLDVVSGSGKLNYHNGTSASPVVTEDHSAILTNKTIDGDNNTVQDLALGSLKTVLTDADKVIRRDAAGIVVSGNALPNSSQIVTLDSSDTLTNKTLTTPIVNTSITGGVSGSLTVQSASNQNLSLQAQGTGVVQLESLSIDANTVTGGAAALVIQSASNQNLSLQAQGTGVVQLESLSVDANTITGGAATLTVQSASNENLTLQSQGTGNVSIQSSGSTGVTIESVIVNSNTITGGTGSALTIQSDSNQNVILQGQGSGFVRSASRLSIDNILDTPSVADNTSGSGVTLAAPTKTIVRLTNAALASVNMIPAGVDGQQLTLVNTTSAAITFNDDTGATAANRIRTGTGAPVTIQNNASIELIYNGTTSRWMIVGGVGGSSSTVNAVAGENLAIGDAVYISLGVSDGGRTAGRVYKVDAANIASPDTRIEYIGFAADAAVAGNSLRVQVAGELGGFVGLTAGQQQFASTATPGGRQTAVPSVNGQWIIPLGIAKDSTTIVINGALSSTATKITGSAVGQFLNVVSTSIDLTLTNTNDVVLASASSGLRTITLPIPSSGKTLTIKKTDSVANSVRVLPAGSETIDGVASYNLSVQYESITVTTDGTNWFII
jgi:hypothetical protein